MNSLTSTSWPLRYRIDDWHQLPDCLSNNSRDLKISVTDIMDDDMLSGLRISVNHNKYGTLFAEIIDAKGYLISKMDHNLVFTLTDQNIFSELAKFGFFVEWSKKYPMSTDQLEYLRTLYGLKYDKIRMLDVRTILNSVETHEIYIVVFMANELQKWLDNMYCATISELSESLVKGYAMNVTAVSNRRNYRWDWLDYVADIKTILENA